MAAAIPRPPGEIIGIQAMRYIAALAVLLDHLIIRLCEGGAAPASWLPMAHRMGAIGVYVFFAISGFVMVLTNREKFQASNSSFDFFARRIIRIWPMYLIATMVVFGARHGGDPLYGFDNLAKSLAFIPYLGEDNLYRPVLGKGWTLNYEMFFYAIFALCLCFPKKIGLSLAGVALVALASAGVVEGGVYWNFYTDSIVLFFLIGMVLAVLTTDTRLRLPHFSSASLAVAAGAGAFVLAIFSGRVSSNETVRQIAMFACVSLCLYVVCFATSRFRSVRLARWVAVLGDSSYVLYLFHGFVMVAMLAVLNKVIQLPPMVLIALVCVVVSVVCVLIHLFLEMPVNRFLLGKYRGVMNRRKAAQESAAAQPAAAGAARAPAKQDSATRVL